MLNSDPVMTDINRKLAVVTGGAKGIGLAISNELAQNGWDLFLCGRDEKALKETTSRLSEQHSIKATYRVMDLSSTAAIDSLFDDWKKQLSYPRALVCNAGDYGVLGNLEKISFEDWKRSFDLNFFSSAKLLQNFIQMTRDLEKQYPGQLHSNRKAMIMSGSGLGGSEAHPGISAYGCAKAALYRLVELVHEETRDLKLDINCLAPGFVKTGITEQAVKAGVETLGKLHDMSKKVLEKGGTQPELAAEMTRLLLSPESDGISGRLISAKWDRKFLETPALTESLKKDVNLLRLRRIDNDLFMGKTT